GITGIAGSVSGVRIVFVGVTRGEFTGVDVTQISAFTGSTDTGIGQDHRGVRQYERAEKQHHAEPGDMEPRNNPSDEARRTDGHRHRIIALPMRYIFGMRLFRRGNRVDLVVIVRLACHTSRIRRPCVPASWSYE